MNLHIRSQHRLALLLWCAAALAAGPLHAAMAPPQGGSASRTLSPASDTLIVHEALGIAFPRRTATTVLLSTPIDAWLAGGRTDAPKAGEKARLADGTELTWQRITSDSLGWFPADPPGDRYAAVTVDLNAPARMILEGMGHDFALVNGALRSGNPYMQADQAEAWDPGFSYSRIPVELVKGKNLLLFRYTRGRLKVRLLHAGRDIVFNERDVTRPDLVVGSALDAWGGIALMNATPAVLKGLSLVASPRGGTADTAAVPLVPAMGMRKAAFRVRMPAPAQKGSVPVRLTLLGTRGGRPTLLDTVTVTLRIVGPVEPRRETFLSSIDGSVQYYAVTPPLPGAQEPPSLFLSLHGAGVEAINQAASYSPKKWGYVVAPTNRRPYGFSWEDWGRLDALEVLDLVTKKFSIDQSRIYLTGHSMGGHGTWFMGATYPDRFAAIGPSAGWITFHTYRFATAKMDSTPVDLMLRRPEATSELFTLVDNYRHFGVYIIHGATDDNVPPQQTYMMLEHLKPILKDLVFYEQPGQGHWWDISPEPGADCVDWKPLFDFFSCHARSGSDRRFTIDFTTADPGVSSRDGWLTIDAQERQLVPSSAHLQMDTDFSRVHGTTVNVSRLSIDRKALHARATAAVELDSQAVSVRLDSVVSGRVWLAKLGGSWRQVSPPTAAEKNARRCGTFKEAFRNRMALVYGTAGSAEENRWASERARYDAEKLWYQGNASVDVLADTEFDPAKEPDRNVIIYGNSRTHRLWKALLGAGPVTVDKGRLTLGERTVKGSDICCIFTRPRAESATASVGVVSGTGIDGFRLSHLVLYLEPGLGLPDLTAFNADLLTDGKRGVIQTGFFGPDWSLEKGEFVTGGR